MECVGADEPVWCVVAILVSHVWVPLCERESWPATGCECSRLVVMTMSRLWCAAVCESQLLVAVLCGVCVCGDLGEGGGVEG